MENKTKIMPTDKRIAIWEKEEGVICPCLDIEKLNLLPERFCLMIMKDTGPPSAHQPLVYRPVECRLVPRSGRMYYYALRADAVKMAKRINQERGLTTRVFFECDHVIYDSSLATVYAPAA